MKSQFRQILLTTAIALSLVSVSSVADAYQCRWVGGHYVNGYYHQAHRVCWHNGYGYGYRHCGWRNGHRVCWYR